MPNLIVEHQRLYYETAGDGAETILFSHGMMWDHRMFEKQIAALSSDFRCVAYDHPGQGGSSVPVGTDEVSIEFATDCAIELIEQLDLAPCHFVGLSMGGFVGMRIAARRPELLTSLTLMATSPEAEEPGSARFMGLLATMIRTLGMGLMSRGAAKQLFSESTRTDPARATTLAEGLAILSDRPRSLYKAVNGVRRRAACDDLLAKIDVPTAVVHGTEDVVFPVETSRALASQISKASFHEVPRTGHSLCFEDPETVNQVLSDFVRSNSNKSEPLG